MSGNWKLAWQSIKRAKVRSFFTMLGIIVGVVAVLSIIALGEGAKQDVRNQAEEYGNDLLIVRPGSTQQGSGFGATTLTDVDVEAVTNAPDVQTVAPLSTVTGVVSYDGQPYEGGGVVATTHAFPELLNHKTEFGEFFQQTDEGRKFAVIGKRVAETVFQENVPIGKALDFRDERYIVKGVLAEFDTSPFGSSLDYNSAVFIPYTTGKAVAEGSSQIFEILAKPGNPAKAAVARAQIAANMEKAHGGQKDFQVLRQTEAARLTNRTLDIMTRLVAAIAGICLLVGGVGVMNVMIVSVTERTKEIGIRKAVGATDQQIMTQFLAEAIILSATAGLTGVGVTYLLILGAHLFTDVDPYLPPVYAGLAILVTLATGIVFGVAPAIKAARKDPITALRRD